MNTTRCAYAKINLHLSVRNRRDDGFHNIFSIMAAIDLYDLLKLESVRTGTTKRSVTIKHAGGTQSAVLDSIAPENNLVYKAAMTYLERAGITADVVFSIQKNIPAGAGLGGGSSDAASALELLNTYFKTMNHEDLMAMGKHIGADVPYCLHGGYAFCWGVGDIIDPIEGSLPYHVLLANNGVHINTADAYKSLNRTEGTDPHMKTIDIIKEEVIKAFETNSLDTVQSLLTNDFEANAFNKYPELKDIKKTFYEHGADFSIMTGSGSTIIALYKNEKKADKALNAMKNYYKLLYKARFIG